MLSILIPIYNYNVVRLVKALRSQAESLKIQYELLCFDDGSRKKYKTVNRTLSGLFGVSYVELKENQGRSKIRNKLARNARYDTLLFIDCDSRLMSNQYLKNYLNYIGKDKIVYGGRSYAKKPPKNKKKLLHWKYGSSREAIAAKKRCIHPYRSFLSNNFLISKSLFNRFKFDEQISGYGYEDLAYAENFKRAGISINHIENPLIHAGLENVDDFIQKHEIAIQNLYQLHSAGLSSRLTDFYDRLSNLNLTPIFNSIFCNKSHKIKHKLSLKPSLFQFDLYRLCLFHNLHKKSQS